MRWTLGAGIVAIVGGVLALMNPPITLAAIMGLIASVAIVIGVVLLVGALRLSSAREDLTGALRSARV